MPSERVVGAVRYTAWSVAAELAALSLDLARHPSLDSGGQVLNARALLDQLEVLVTFLERTQGHSWADIADRLGVERQSLHRRMSRKVDEAGMDAEHRLRQKGYARSLQRNLERDLKVLAAEVADMLAASRPVRDLGREQ